MRDRLIFYLNGRRQEVAGTDALLTLSNYLRRCGLVGTKIVCSEGDCGSCTVLIGRPENDRFAYRPIDSCILLMFQVDGTHVVTIEGLQKNDNLTAVQSAMIGCHGSQCGFCTPGFVVTMTGLLEDGQALSEADWRSGLTGNLCRCTGYVPIIQAGLKAQRSETLETERMDAIYPPRPILEDLARFAEQSISIEARELRRQRVRRLLSPTSVAELLEVLACFPDAKVVAGATDVGVQLNKGLIDPDVFLDLSRVSELTGTSIRDNGEQEVLDVGAATSWARLLLLLRDRVSEFHEIISIFGSPQIRNVGTIGGNIINASPIADSLPFLLVCEAELELTSPAGKRRVAINDFYRGYKKMDLRRGELLTRISIPLPQCDDLLRLMRVSRRRDLDIATFTAAILLRRDGDEIDSARVAFGGVGPTVARARQTEQFLAGRPFDEPTMRAAGDIAAGEISPISDVRGSDRFRYQLTRNVFLKTYFEYREKSPIVSVS